LTETASRSESQPIPTASGDALAATLYRPGGVEGQAPCVVMGAGGTLTQRDGIPDYAERFAAALCLDTSSARRLALCRGACAHDRGR
jgi:hypothetical protein